MNWNSSQTSRLRRLFLEGFSAMDIAEPLVSFDAGADAGNVREFMEARDYDLVGVRKDGLVEGYVRRDELSGGTCLDHLRSFSQQDDLVASTASLKEVVMSLAVNRQCFVTILDHVGAIITLSDLEKPPMRMFLFGMITVGEMMMTDIIRRRYGDGAWQELISPQRLAKAKDLQAERVRRGNNPDLIDCLQYGDKGVILTYDEEIRKALGQESRRAACKAIGELETLRNNLAHTQEIVPVSWQRIIDMCSRFEHNLGTISERMDNLGRPENPSA